MATMTAGNYMARQKPSERRHTWRQKVLIHDPESGVYTFYVDFGEYDDGRLAEVFITSQKTGSFARGTLDALARSVSLALQSGTSPHELANTLRGMDYPPAGMVEAKGSPIDGLKCTSLADYIGQEIVACYGEDGRCKSVDEVVTEVIEVTVPKPIVEKKAGTDTSKHTGA